MAVLSSMGSLVMSLLQPPVAMAGIMFSRSRTSRFLGISMIPSTCQRCLALLPASGSSLPGWAVHAGLRSWLLQSARAAHLQGCLKHGRTTVVVKTVKST
jgi:hypothetical protein